MIRDKRKQTTKRKKTAGKKKRKTSRRRNPETLGVGETIALKGKGQKYHIAFTVGDEVIFKTDDSYEKAVAKALIPTFQEALVKAIKEEDKRKNPRPRKYEMVSSLLDDNFEEAISKTQSLPPNPQEAFHLGFVAGLSHGLKYNALLDFFEKRRIRKRIKAALDSGLSDLTAAVIQKQTKGTPIIRTQKVTK